MGAFARYIVKVGILIILFPMRLFKVKKNKVLFVNQIMLKDGDFSANPKYLALYMLENFPDKFDIYLMTGKGAVSDEIKDLKINAVTENSLSYFYHAMTCGFFVTTSGGISYIPFRKSQTVINTWHGGGAYKKMSLDIDDSESLRKAVKITEKKTDYFLSSNEMFSEIIQSAFLMHKEKIRDFGLPRNDIFFQEREDIKDKVRSYYKIDKESKILLYAPTYRSADESIYKKHVLGPYELDYENVLQALELRFGGNWVLGIRLHPSISDVELSLPDNVINMTLYPDIQELMYTSDILINDYSSTMWDFSLTRKPCFIFATDLYSYTSKLGFYTEPSSWPFPLAESNEELIDNIQSFDSLDYSKSLEHYFDWMGNHDKGIACQQTVDLMNEIMEEGLKNA